MNKQELKDAINSIGCQIYDLEHEKYRLQEELEELEKREKEND